MNDIATLLAQLGTRAEPAADPALAAVRLARASLDALVVKLGQSIDAKVTAQLVAGLTQLTAGNESFVLKLETPLPVGTPVTVKVTPSPSGSPTVTVTPQPAVVAAPLAVATPPVAVPMERPRAASAATSTPPVKPTTAPATEAAPTAGIPVSPKAASGLPASPQGSAPAPATNTSAASPTPVTPPSVTAPPSATVAPAATAAPVQQSVAVSSPQAPVSTSVAVSQPAPMPTVLPQPPSPATPPVSPPVVAAAPTPASASPPAASPSPMPTATPGAPAALSVQQATASYGSLNPPLPTASQMPAPQPPVAAAQVLAPSPDTAPLPAAPAPKGAGAPVQVAAAPNAPLVAEAAPVTPRVASMPLQQVLADPVQAAARQTTVVPLLTQAAAILAAPTAAALPLPVLEAIARVLAARVDLNRAPPDGKALRQAVLQAGTLDSGPRQPDDQRSTLLALRSTLAAFLGSKVEAVAPITHRPPPPMAGEPARAGQSTPAAPLPDLSPEETAKQLLGHTDGALARTKLLQLASSSPDLRAPNPATSAELRFEIPMLLGTETGILQLLVHRDGRHKPDPRERGWRMRFAMSFSSTGEVGADIALLGRVANVSIWAVEPATADALEAMLPELAPALASHGLDVAGLRVRRGPPPRRLHAPGRLLDSAR